MQIKGPIFSHMGKNTHKHTQSYGGKDSPLLLAIYIKNLERRGVFVCVCVLYLAVVCCIWQFVNLKTTTGFS